MINHDGKVLCRAARQNQWFCEEESGSTCEHFRGQLRDRRSRRRDYRWDAWLFDWIGSLAGVLVGAIVGGFALPFLVFGMFMVGIFFESGFTGLRELFPSSHGTVVGECQTPEGSTDAEPF